MGVDLSLSFTELSPTVYLRLESADLLTKMRAERSEYIFKVLVIGELGSGKTSLIKRYVHDFFTQHYRATIGVDFALKVVHHNDHTLVRLQLWDIAGQERFGNMTRVYYRDAAAAFVVFDLSRIATFEAAAKWKDDLDMKVVTGDGSRVPAILLANKCDLRDESTVNDAEIEQFSKEHGFAAWYRVSAKEGTQVEEAGSHIISLVLDREDVSSKKVSSPISASR